jgi:ABC-type branched-subunit amino acid transport system ATPase component
MYGAAADSTPVMARFQGQQQVLAIGRPRRGTRLLFLGEPSLGLSPLLTDMVPGHSLFTVADGTAVLPTEQSVA